MEEMARYIFKDLGKDYNHQFIIERKDSVTKETEFFYFSSEEEVNNFKTSSVKRNVTRNK